LSKALLKLSQKCGLHPTCFDLRGLKKIGHQLAGGGFGDIWKGVVKGQTVAIKSMRIFLEDDIKSVLKAFGREALIWHQLSHPNLLPFFGLYTLDGRLCLASPWMNNGSLQQFIRDNPSDIRKVPLISDVTVGLQYVHSKNIVHGDLKASNILITASGRACIADFGLSSIVAKMSLEFTQSTDSLRGGTPRYQAPELLSGASVNNFGSDVYGFACVCYEILAGKVPFFELANEIMVGIKVIGGDRPSKPRTMASEGLWAILEACWRQDPDDRPTMTDVLQRLHDLGALIPKKTSPSETAWDRTCSARFRHYVRRWPQLLPSAHAVERYIRDDLPAEVAGREGDPWFDIDAIRPRSISH
ncbi:kinase-like domain-containing protein, partial [Mycena capillaripes]